MFEITEYQEAHVATFTKRVEKHGDQDKQAVSMGLEITSENFILDMIDPTLRHALYRAKDEAQVVADGVVPTTPVLRSNSIDRAVLPTKHEGWTLECDHGAGDDDSMKFGGCKLSKFSVEPKQGGTVVLRFTVGTSDLDEGRLGWLGMQHGDSIWIKLHAPRPKADAIDGSTEAFQKDHPDAGSLFAAEHGSEEGDTDGPEDEGEGESEGSEPDIETAFPSDSKEFDVGIERSQPGTRTARGREKTKAALEAGTH